MPSQFTDSISAIMLHCNRRRKPGQCLDNFSNFEDVCSFCTIPLARGKSRSDSIEKTVKLANSAIEEGAKELVLTGVNIGDFGKQKNENFLDLIQEENMILTDSFLNSSIISF